jgi:NSS family neurotransmitter:Na+ symporter
LGLIISWIWIVFSVWKGAKTVSKVVYFTVLVPWLLLIVFVVRGITLPGAMDGLAYYLTPDFSKLLNPGVWLAAYTQIFFSLSVGFGIMIAYSSFLPRKTDLVNNAFIVGFADALTAFVGGLAVFGGLGYHAHILGKSVGELGNIAGPGLAFVTYPAIISNLPLAPFFGVLFFLMLLTLAIDSAFSMV